jgi:tripartite-type tricarboxylate transporter receptor subunit TctC
MVIHRLCLAALAALGFQTSNPTYAQVFPSRPISIVVPYAAGGPTDTIARIMAERMRLSLGQPFIVPYRGSGPAMQDLIAGQIDLMFDIAGNSLAQVRAGKIRAYAVTANSRLPAAPEILRVDEAGLPEFHFSSWHAFWAPKKTANNVIGKLNAAVVDALADPTVRHRLANLGQEIPAGEEQMPGVLAAFHKAETEKWWPIIKAANIKSE